MGRNQAGSTYSGLKRYQFRCMTEMITIKAHLYVQPSRILGLEDAWIRIRELQQHRETDPGQ